jgi:G protein beta subunit-like protein
MIENEMKNFGQTLAKHQRWVWDIVFSADSMHLLLASSDQSAKLWDLRSGDVVRSYVMNCQRLGVD